MELWIGGKSGVGVDAPTRSPVATSVWGAAGSGKSHLLKAAREALREQGARVGWLDASVFNAPEFSESWTAVMLDDVQLYTAEQQHTAFNWFVHAQTLQRPVIAAGEWSPSELKLRDDLRTRLGWGHVFGLQLLSEEQSRAVLRQAADARGLFLSDEVMDFTLRRFSRDLGSLMELLDLLDRYALQTKRAITIPLIKSMLETA
jgi:DnaA family protein